MTARRQFIKTLAGVPPLLALQPAFAAPDPTRVALIIGNADYLQSPLANPTNGLTGGFVPAYNNTESNNAQTREDPARWNTRRDSAVRGRY